MTITTCLAVSYATMLRIRNGSFQPHKAFNNFWVISVTDPDAPRLFGDSYNILTLQFHDIDPGPLTTDKIQHITQAEGKILFDDVMAKKVIEFVKKASNTSGKGLMLVNCMAGISRSGAIASYVQRVCGIDYKEFRRLNPNISPNDFVLEMLELHSNT